MRNTVKTLIAAAVLAGTAIAATAPAQAMMVRNCTGDVIRVNVYNNDDALRVIPKFGGTIGPGETRSAYSNAPRSFIKVFRAQVIDRLMVERGGIPDGSSISILPGYRIGNGSSCR